MSERYEVFMAVPMKNAVFWNVVVYIEPTRRHIPEDGILQDNACFVRRLCYNSNQ
jgi:hypothetical protein